jgi:Na+-driven multidrug efflux pump
VAYVVYPQLLRSYYEADGDPAAIRGRVERVLRLLALLVPGLCGLAFLCAREAVTAILPSYVPGVTAIRVLCFGAGALAIGNLSSIVLMTLGLQRFLAPAALFSTLLGATLDYLAVRAGYGISGVAWATFVTYGVSSLVLLWLALGGLGGPVRWRLGGVARNFLPLVFSIALATGLDRLLPWRGSSEIAARLARLALATVAFVALYTGACRPFTRGMGFRQMLSGFNLPWMRRNGSMDE